VNGVEPFRLPAREVLEAHGTNGESRVFDAGKDAPGNAGANGIRFDYRERPVHRLQMISQR